LKVQHFFLQLQLVLHQPRVRGLRVVKLFEVLGLDGTHFYPVARVSTCSRKEMTHLDFVEQVLLVRHGLVLGDQDLFQFNFARPQGLELYPLLNDGTVQA
jgi:hypothetical protein